MLRLYDSAFYASAQDSHSLANWNGVGKVKSLSISLGYGHLRAFACPVASDLTSSFGDRPYPHRGILLPLITLPCARHCVRAGLAPAFLSPPSDLSYG